MFIPPQFFALVGVVCFACLAIVQLDAAAPIVVYDLSDELAAVNSDDPVALRKHYDEVILVTCLQGIVNRDQPRLFVRYNTASDDFWFSKMTEPGGWLADRSIERPETIKDLLAHFPSVSKGLVIWDERVPATSNLAATVAGVEDLLSVRWDESEGSLYRQLTSKEGGLGVARRLLAKDDSPLFTGKGKIPDTERESTGSAKNDAYVWLLENYIRAGKTNDRVLGYYIDAYWLQCARAQPLPNHTINNLDYLIAKRAPIVDLNVWEDETPVDERTQKPGTDAKTFREILAEMVKANGQKSMIAVYGFPPWAFKYSKVTTSGWDSGGTHEPVLTEWKFSETISLHNGYMDADALGHSSFPNASFYQNYVVPEVVKQNAVPTRERLIREGILDNDGGLLTLNYYAHYQGDFDAGAWVYSFFPKILVDPARGTLPLSWAINPTLASRFPFGLHYIRTHSQPGEVFVAGEAAGYLKPSLLQTPRPAPGLPDALDLWVAHNQKWYRQWDINVTGFSIDGATPPMNDRGFAAYQKFSPGGLGLQRAPASVGMKGDLPFAQMMTDLPGSEGNADMGQTADALRGFFEPDEINFVMVRSILQLPSYYADIQRRLQDPGNLPNKLVDLPTLFWLIREFETNPAYVKLRPVYANAKSVSARPAERNGLRNRRVADGIATVVDANGKPAWNANGLLYFDVANDFAKTVAGKGAKLRVTYVDIAAGTIGVQYDSSDKAAMVDGAFKSAPNLPTTGSGKVTTAEFNLSDAIFSGRQNASTDLRLDTGGKPMRIISVEVIKN